MSLFRSVVLYTALSLCANAALADMGAVAALRDGDMKKLNFHAEAKAPVEATLLDAGGAKSALADYRGKYVLLNFWATWCAPCRKEMPSLDRLQAELGGETFAVVPVATGHNPVPGIERFFADGGIETLPILRDPKQELSRQMAVLGLPVTVILDPEGREIARMTGDAEWDSDSAKAIIAALLDQTAG
ncbi:TlpA family protein disulfide reductase [Actibacterium ureilyticum]|uniref:TlpA family protein disulfide reductase n=1 Tax=Actibacterium ureilyticum TaxID=1590614 RepID=UPI000BAAB954|nr:TlpA disulfide reductase family protein [Actibacterium ureilyticum]